MAKHNEPAEEEEVTVAKEAEEDGAEALPT